MWSYYLLEFSLLLRLKWKTGQPLDRSDFAKQFLAYLHETEERREYQGPFTPNFAAILGKCDLFFWRDRDIKIANVYTLQFKCNFCCNFSAIYSEYF